jgi:hypothetical protein
MEIANEMRTLARNQYCSSITRYGVGKQSLFNIDVRIHTHRFDHIAALEKAEADNAKLQEQLNRATEGGSGSGTNEEDSPMIPRPAGTAGSKWSIQVEMGLGGTGKKYDLYKAIQVGGLIHKLIVHLPMMHMYTRARTTAECSRLGT